MAEGKSIKREETIPVLVQTKTVKEITHLYRTRHMSCLRDDQVWVSDDRGNLVLTDSNGNTLDKVSVDIFADNGFHTVNDDGELLFTDEHHNVVNKVSVNKKIQVIIKTDKWAPISIFCSLITGNVMVGLRKDEYRFTKDGKGKVELYSRTYKKLNTFKKDYQGYDLYGEPLYIIENFNGDICVSDWKRKAVVVVDSNGRHKFSYSGHSSDPFFCPSGLCPDTHGRLVIYNSQMRTVHLIDMNGNFLSILLNKLPVPEQFDFEALGPTGLCWDKKDNLWVGEYMEASVKIYHYQQNKTL